MSRLPKFRCPALRSSIACAALLVCASAQALPVGSFVENFNAAGPAGTYTGANIAGLAGHPNAMPAPFETGPDAFSTGEFLRLKEFTASGFQRSFNTVLFDHTNPGLFDRVVIDFDFRVTCGGQRVVGAGFDFRCADGFSVGWMSTDVVGTSGIPNVDYGGGLIRPFLLGENGTSSAVPRHESLAVGFNTFDNLEGSNNSLNVIFNGSAVGVSRYHLGPAGFDIVTGSNRVRGEFQHAQLDMVLGGASPHLTVTLTDPDGDSITPYDLDLTGLVVAGVPYAPYDARLGFFTRTGDSQESVDIDNVNVQLFSFAPAPEPATFLLIVPALALAARSTRQRRNA